MTRPSSFLTTSSLVGLSPLNAAGRPLLKDSARLLALLREKAPALAPLFAEPLLGREEGDGPNTISWYCAYDVAGHGLDQLQPAKRQQVLETLRHRLEDLLALRDDPELGPLLPSLLTLPSAGSVMAVGTAPVLINWSVAPEGVAPTPEGLQAQFDAVFGPLCGVTWDRPEPAPSGAAPLVAGAIAAGAVGLGAAATASAATPEPGPDADAPVDSEATPAGAAGVGVGAAGAGATAATAAAVVVVPWYARPWVHIVAAVLLLLLILALLWWLLWAPGGLLNRPVVPPNLHAPVIEGLRNERNRLEDLLQQQCSPALLDAARDGYSGQLTPPPPRSETPRSETPWADPSTPLDPNAPLDPDRPFADPPPDLGPEGEPGTQGSITGSSMTALARSLERSVVLVFGDGRGGMSMGTGFFVAPDTIVTNRHVIEDMSPARIRITSQFLNGVRSAQLVASTRNSDIGQPDFAVLRLNAPVEGVRPLAIAAQVSNLARVVTAGYPAYISQSDTAFQSLMSGNVSAAPAMVFTSGEVSVVQPQATGTSVVVHTADMSQGNSGGPLVDLCGRVVGVNTFIGMDGESGRRGLYSLSGGDLLRFLAANTVPAERGAEACTEEAVSAETRPNPPAEAPPEASPEASPETAPEAAPESDPQPDPEATPPSDSPPPDSPPSDSPTRDRRSARQ